VMVRRVGDAIWRIVTEGGTFRLAPTVNRVIHVEGLLKIYLAIATGTGTNGVLLGPGGPPCSSDVEPSLQ